MEDGGQPLNLLDVLTHQAILPRVNLHGVLNPHFSDGGFSAIEMQREKRLYLWDGMFIILPCLLEFFMFYGLGEG